MQKSAVEDQMGLARAIVRNLVRKGVKLLALDFDQTIVSIHTGGAWRGPSSKLAQHVRPCFRALMEAALELTDLHVCVVTYSLQQCVIEDALKFVLPNSDAGRIVVRTTSKEWLLGSKNQTGGGGAPSCLGKQQHIAQVTTDLYNQRHAVIQPHEILLVDDDDENVQIARHFGHLAFLVRDGVNLDEIYTFVDRLKDATTFLPSSYSLFVPLSSSTVRSNPGGIIVVDSSCGPPPPPPAATAGNSSGVGLAGNAAQLPQASFHRQQQQQQHGHSAQTYVTGGSRSYVTTTQDSSYRHSSYTPPSSAVDVTTVASTSSGFVIPRPAIVSENRWPSQGEMRVNQGERGRGGAADNYDRDRPKMYVVMTSER